MSGRPITFLCLSNYVKGELLLEECRELGVRTVLLTQEKLKDAQGWPDCIDETFYINDLGRLHDLTLAVSYLARSRDFDGVIPLDDYAVETAAHLREHLRCPGMGASTARYFRDKLAMRVRAKEAGLNVPAFVHALNHRKIDAFTREASPPWMIKPRSEAGSVQIKKIEDAASLWKAVHSLGDRQSFHLIETYVPGEVFHVDSAVWDRQVVFSVGHRYWRPPFNVWNEGGVFMTERVATHDPLSEELLEANRVAIQAMGLVRGVTHVEFIRAHHDGKLYFLELAARVGGAHIDRLVEAQTGINLWREWARLESAYVRGEEYRVEPTRDLHGGLLLCLSKQECPDLSSFDDPEVSWKLASGYHAGIVLAGSDSDRVHHLMEAYRQRVESDILAIAPPTSKPA
ncbi:MAG: ATP-grasp domain-containing protein [Vulcanimicrobiota bacterium]